MAEDDLFNNPMVQEAKKAMPEEMQKRYAHYGAQLHSINFETIDQEQLSIALLWLDKALKAGMLIDELSTDEVAALQAHFGDQWQQRYVFDKH